MPSRHSRARQVSGILLLDKPRGLSSNQALQRTKKLFKAAKAGHTGSLDPLATGMLPVCLGAATKLSSYLLGAEKRYTVCGVLGVATDTGDAEGKPTEQGERPELDAASVQSTLQMFLGEIEQIPPMHSALKHKGTRLYELARQGIEVERAPRTVRIRSITLVRYEWPRLELRVTCSKGTYIRTLVQDIAHGLGTCGHVQALRRDAVAPFGEEQMVDMEMLEQCAGIGLTALDELLLPADSALDKWPRLVMGHEQASRLAHGQTVKAEPQWPRTWVRLYSPSEDFFGIGEVLPDGELVPRRIFPVLSSWN